MNYAIHWEYVEEDDPFPELRSVLGHAYEQASAEEIETVSLHHYGVSAAEMEDWLSTLKDIGGAVVAALPAIVSGAASGAGTGATVGTVVPGVGNVAGGIIGGIAGAGMGAVSSGAFNKYFDGGTKPTHAPSPARPHPSQHGPHVGPRQYPTTRPAPQVMPRGQVPQAGVGQVGSAAFDLLQVILNPQVIKGMLSLAGGVPADTKIKLGGVDVPVGAIANIIGKFAGEAVQEHMALTGGAPESLPEYLMSDEGALLCDPASAEQRMDVLFGHILRDNEDLAEQWGEEFGTNEDWDEFIYA